MDGGGVRGEGWGERASRLRGMGEGGRVKGWGVGGGRKGGWRGGGTGVG